MTDLDSTDPVAMVPVTSIVSSAQLIASLGCDDAAARWLASEIAGAIRNAQSDVPVEETIAKAILYCLRGISRFWCFVEKRDPGECWPWLSRTNEKGYGELRWAGKFRLAHHISYGLAYGQRPAGLAIDHTCHTQDTACYANDKCPHRRCVNPAHLEAITGAMNTLRGRGLFAANKRKTACIHGHPFDESNTRFRPDGARSCRQCERESHVRTEEKRRAARRARKEVAA